MKRWKRIAAGMLAILLLITSVTEVAAAEEEEMPGANSRIAYTANTKATLMLNTYLGATGDIVSWLKSHEKDNYYLTTPFYGKLSNKSRCIRPKGEYKTNAGMNCTGFVASVMKAMGGDLSKITTRLNHSYVNACNWNDTVKKKNIRSYRYTSIQKMLASGKLEKGDLIYFEPDWSKSGSDCHIGFFWGDSSSDNKFWHSAKGQGNAITKIKSVSNYQYVYIFKTQKRGSLQVNVSVAGEEGASGKGLTYQLYNSSGKLAATLTINGGNTSSKTNLPVGTYTLKQATSLSGYQKDTKTYTVKITNGNTTIQNLQVTKNEKQEPTETVCSHTWSASGTVVKEPTSEFEGEMSYTCTLCGEKKSEPIAKLTSLAKPVLVSATNQNGSVTVKWNGVTYAKGYIIYRKQKGGTWSKIATVTSRTTRSYVDKTVSAGKTYVYTVKAYNGSLLSARDTQGVSVQIPKTVYVKYKTKTKVKYRKGPGTSYKKVGTLKKNKTVQVLKGYSKKANGYTWYKVKINAKTYYVAAKYLKKVS